MYRSMHRVAFVTACVSLLLLAGCGKKVESTAPLSFAPVDTPYLYANFKPLPDDVASAWRSKADALRPYSAQSYGKFAEVLRADNPDIANELQAVAAELASAKSAQQFDQQTGLSPQRRFALYGIGLAPVLRFELADPQAFRAFIARVEKRVGHPFTTATLDGQQYWVNSYGNDKLQALLAVEGNQAVATLAPANADPALLKRLLGLSKPEHSAADRLADIDGARGYTDYGSGYLDLPKLLARLSDPNDPVTKAYAAALGAPAPGSDPSCPAEFASIGAQMPLASFGTEQFEADHVRASLDVSLSAPLRTMLASLEQPVPGMAAKSDGSLFDLVLALPLRKIQAFWQARAQAVAAHPYTCPTLAPLNEGFKAMAAGLQQQMPPEVASLIGLRVVLDNLVLGGGPASSPQVAARAQLASTDPDALLQEAQKNLPQLAITPVKADGKPIAVTLPPQLQSLAGGASQGWIAADRHSIGIAIGNGEEGKLAGMLAADAGDGSALLRMHLDGKLYGIFADFSDSLIKKMPPAMQPQLQQQGGMMRLYAKWLRGVDAKVVLDDEGLHVQGEAMLAQ
ncbi:MAG TPA: hypothetical protein VF217_02615 [Rhodanobacteraceae bacterium]